MHPDCNGDCTAMKTIFEASSGLEAHMILNLLQQQGIDCRIDGEYLQGGVGELQAMNYVRVLVDDSDVGKAQAIIDEWDARQVNSTDYQRSVKKSTGLAAGMLFGLLIGVGLTFWAYNSPVTTEGVDHNNDGQLDEVWMYKDGRVSTIKVDRNLDGETDLIYRYNRKGLLYKTDADENFDGVYETTYKYRRGNIYLQESDVNQDDTVDLVGRYENGNLSEIDIFDPVTNIPRKKQNYKMGKLSSAEFDSNGDGVYDTVYAYDYYEEIEKKSSKTLD